MIKKIHIFPVALCLLIFTFSAYSLNLSDHRIAVLVNDELITSYDIVQRIKKNAIISGINITPENKDEFTTTVIDELIEQKLKNQKMNEYDITVNDDEYLRRESEFYKSLSLNKDGISKMFEINNIDYNEFKNFLIHQISWQKLVSGMYFRLTSASKIEIDEIIINNPSVTENEARNIIIERQLELKSDKMIRDMLDEATIEYK